LKPYSGRGSVLFSRVRFNPDLEAGKSARLERYGQEAEVWLYGSSRTQGCKIFAALLMYQ
jgi:hypothetical protein